MRIKKYNYNLINTINVKKHLKGIQAEKTFKRNFINLFNAASTSFLIKSIPNGLLPSEIQIFNSLFG